jgi:hypothetical protein
LNYLETYPESYKQSSYSELETRLKHGLDIFLSYSVPLKKVDILVEYVKGFQMSYWLKHLEIYLRSYKLLTYSESLVKQSRSQSSKAAAGQTEPWPIKQDCGQLSRVAASQKKGAKQSCSWQNKVVTI